MIPPQRSTFFSADRFIRERVGTGKSIGSSNLVKRRYGDLRRLRRWVASGVQVRAGTDD